MVVNRLHSFLVTQVDSILVCLKAWPLRSFFAIVDPLEGPRAARVIWRQRLDRTHLRVDKRVAKEQFIASESWLAVAEFVPLAGHI